MRVVLGISYSGTRYEGWQSQLSGETIQDKLESAIQKFTGRDQLIRVNCAGRTDSGVHALNQVVHFDTDIARDESSWVRAVNRYLPTDIAVQWCHFVPQEFHSRQSAQKRQYLYLLKSSPVRPSLESHRVGWCWQNLSLAAMQEAASYLEGEHDFSAFRSSECQAPSPIKHLETIQIDQYGCYWRFLFAADAFLHHMIRNLMGELVAVGSGKQPAARTKAVLESRQRSEAAPTFSPDGLYFLGPEYDDQWGLPKTESNLLFLPIYASF